ncbi:MAG: 23S rRNA (uracil(1939)-C(5))-methyltransferase RlmD [Syntrophobacterales bacterium]|nr:23S rRNA (uracil(1939)-C(5))-methyltransferase RlmD [Syntrophobacterales bacterium]
MDNKLHAGDIIKTSIEAVAFGGNGVGRTDDMVVFIPFTAAGDTVEAKIMEVKRNYCIGEITEIITPSPDRVEPVCPYFSTCGGCQYQHISYKAQLETKERQVTESFERIGKITSPPVKAIIPSPQAFNYRGKAEFHCIPDADGQLNLGFMDTVGGKLVEIEACNIVDESINTEYRKLREMLASGEIASYRKRYILWSETTYPPGKYITRTAKEKEVRIANDGFFQGNIYLVDTLIEQIIDMCDLKESDTVLDCYCGAGLFSLFIAPRVTKVLGMEISGTAIHCATHNAREYGITNTRFYKGNVENILGRFIKENTRADIVLIDPPRTGCTKKTLARIDTLKPKRIVYISCNPATQARDIRYLTGRGFSLETLQPVDMFPQTKHIEVIALLTR